MKLNKIEHINNFLAAIDTCEGDVYLTSPYGDKFNLKSKISQYVAIAALVSEHGDEMEIWCDQKDDERRLLAFFAQHPEIL